MEQALQVSSRKAAFCKRMTVLGENKRSRYARPGRNGVIALLFVLTVLGILLVEVIEIHNKCKELPAQELVPDTNFTASR